MFCFIGKSYLHLQTTNKIINQNFYYDSRRNGVNKKIRADD